MTTQRRQALIHLAGLGLASQTGQLFAQSTAISRYPEKQIRLFCPFAPAGGVDLTARLLAQKMSQSWGQPVVVENRPGANGMIAVDLVAKSPPDGYTLTMISSSHSVNVTLQGNQAYNLDRDLVPITQATTQPYVLVVNPSLQAKSVAELRALARSKPGGLTYGSSGIGGFSHLAGALLEVLGGIKLTHVPYKGGSLAMNDVISGQIDMLFSTILQSNAHISSGRLRPLAVSSLQRSPTLPNTPTMQEAGVDGYEMAGWYGVMAPRGTPAPIVEKLNREMVRILKLPETRERLAGDGSDPVGSTPAEFGTHVSTEVKRWAKLIKELDIRSQ
jgi:tripartite-type tricarboxylate transporter receptor subunit TctC